MFLKPGGFEGQHHKGLPRQNSANRQPAQSPLTAKIHPLTHQSHDTGPYDVPTDVGHAVERTNCNIGIAHFDATRTYRPQCP